MNTDKYRCLALVLSLLVASFVFAQTAPSNYGETDFPSGTFNGLTSQQKKDVLQVLNSKKCDCGCRNGTIAQCRIKDDKCSISKNYITQAVQLAASGNNAIQIRLSLDSAKLPAPKRNAIPAVSMVLFRPDDPFRGPQFAKVTIIEFSDFQCPFCGAAYSTVEKIMQAYPGQIKLVFKHKPLSFHANAMPAAEAAEAARDQGKFWEMYSFLFKNQRFLSSENYQQWAKQLDLNLYQFRGALRTHRNQSRIEEDSTLANLVGVSGTPSFFVNGRILRGAYPFEQFKKVVDEELAKADTALKNGKKLDSSFYASMVNENKKKLNPPPTSAVPASK